VPCGDVDERQRRFGAGLGVGFTFVGLGVGFSFTLFGFGVFILIGFGVGRFRCPHRHVKANVSQLLGAARIGVEPIGNVIDGFVQFRQQHDTDALGHTM
jgi:hypothetical protein